MQFNSTAIKATLFSTLVSLSTFAFAGEDRGWNPIPAPTCTPTPDPIHTPAPAAVPEPSAWLSLAVGAFAIIALTAWNRSKAAKSSN